MRQAMTAVLLISVAGAATVQAQQPGVSDDRLGARTAPILLLTRGDVRADLGMTPEQSQAADAAIADFYHRAEALRGQGNSPAVVAARKAIDQASRHWIAANLSPEQQARLIQIDLQWEGPAALATRGSIAAALGLTPDQVKTLRAAHEQQRRGGPEAQRQLAETALSMLTPEQRDRWKAMLGRPLAVQMTSAPRPATR